MSVLQKRKNIRTIDFKQGPDSAKYHHNNHGHHPRKRPRYVDVSDDERPRINGTSPHKMVNGHKIKKSKHKHDHNQPTLSVNGTGETSHSKNNMLKVQLQEQRKQLPIAKGMSKFRIIIGAYTDTASQVANLSSRRLANMTLLSF